MINLFVLLLFFTSSWPDLSCQRPWWHRRQLFISYLWQRIFREGGTQRRLRRTWVSREPTWS